VRMQRDEKGEEREAAPGRIHPPAHDGGHGVRRRNRPGPGDGGPGYRGARRGLSDEAADDRESGGGVLHKPPGSRDTGTHGGGRGVPVGHQGIG